MAGLWIASRLRGSFSKVRWFELGSGSLAREAGAVHVTRGDIDDLRNAAPSSFDVVSVAQGSLFPSAPLLAISRALASRGTLAVCAPESWNFQDCGVFPLVEHHSMVIEGSVVAIALARRAPHVDDGLVHPPPPSLFVKGAPPRGRRTRVPLAPP